MLAVILAWLTCGLATAAEGGSSPWVRTPRGDVRLVAAAGRGGDATTVRLGLHFILPPHWKIYWRSPGDAGSPSTIDWSGSRNLAKAVMAWPAPRRFSLQGIETAGYEGEVVVPITVTLAQPGAPLWVRANVDFLVCAEICVPQQVVLEMDMPVPDGTPSPFAHLIERHATRVPGDGNRVGMRLVAAVTGTDGKDGFIAVEVEAEPPLVAPDLFVEGGGSVGAPQVQQNGTRTVLRAPVTPPLPSGTPVTLTLVDDAAANGSRAMETHVSLAAARGALGEDLRKDTAAMKAGMIGIALLGGLILNLMPCVLPVLSLKIIGLIGHGGAEGRGVRWSFMASAAGILFSFLLLAAAAIGVKAAGAAVGWGIQFQHPVFLAAMVTVLTAFAANLWGLFEIPLPAGLAALGGAKGRGHAGAFLTGAFATVLATPCSAPFLGTAVGFALARGPVEIVLIFSALGVGMAAPYLLVAAFPVLATRLPRPGRWMLRVRGVMGVALAGTALWLLTVLAAQAGMPAALGIGAVLGGGVGLLALQQRLPMGVRPFAPFVVLGLMGLALMIPAESGREKAESGGPWQPFGEEVLARHVAEGQVVFVDVTADWCVTCQVNKALVLLRGAVAARLRTVVALRADWTRPDAGIAAYLARFDRYGIPFNAVYGPGLPKGQALPELLTTEAVLQALDAAAGNPKQE
ncbi:MAG: Thiol:disulfide interchange protein dsbD 1 precursor [Rhodospirillaceae bacterium]|nr:MAG: Thiol:disulfide interchange protein dsbD 1 precursor [Rhodospirillaceae bacterium]